MDCRPEVYASAYWSAQSMDFYPGETSCSAKSHLGETFFSHLTFASLWANKVNRCVCVLDTTSNQGTKDLFKNIGIKVEEDNSY